MGATILSNLIGAAIGGLITWRVARWYYVRATKDFEERIGRATKGFEEQIGRATKGFEEQLAKLKKLVTFVLLSLERQGMATLKRDSTGEITDFVIELSSTMRATPAILKGEATATPKPPDPA
jgi:hypothetical protein